MRRLVPLVLVAFAAAMWAAGDGGVARTPHGLPTEAGQAVAPHEETAFFTVDVFMDTGATGLAAWQLEFAPRARDGAKVTLVGIEGGEPAAYSKPAYYDPAALAPEGGGRVILAAYSTGKGLPTGRTRVARLHVMVEGGGDAGGEGPEFKVDVKVAADAEGRAIDGASATAAKSTAASNGGDR